MIDMIASLFKRQILHMIEALLDVMKWPSWILHMSDCVTTSTIAAIIVFCPRPIFHCARSTVLLLRNSEWTRCFSFLLLRMWTFFPPGSNLQSVNWPPQSLSRYKGSLLRGHRRLPGEAVQGAGPAPEPVAGGFLAFVSNLKVHKLALPAMTLEEI